MAPRALVTKNTSSKIPDSLSLSLTSRAPLEPSVMTTENSSSEKRVLRIWMAVII